MKDEEKTELRKESEFGEKLKILRTKKNMTQEQLAEKLFVSRVTVSKWESGRGLPNIDSLKLLAKTMDVSVDALLCGSEIVCVAEKQIFQTGENFQRFFIALTDILCVLLLFLPIYTDFSNATFRQTVISSLHTANVLTKIGHYFFDILIVLFGIIEIAIQNVQKIQVIQGGIKKTGFQIQAIFSVLITLIAVIWNIITRQMYVSVFLVFMLALKFFILISFFSTIIKYKTDKL
ncbi:helix-turn-helix transcriptional regulator [uncultured Treponema sp.]|uniref:helix-turn-helix domain-containing protein n=2 Tax=uncultured Treponema sp. TaxID=162155 RepID=UPI0025DBC1E1|nr:helix-turn-helix transcriptional regulator [uncultured Treponema sp.]